MCVCVCVVCGVCVCVCVCVCVLCVVECAWYMYVVCVVRVSGVCGGGGGGKSVYYCLMRYIMYPCFLIPS